MLGHYLTGGGGEQNQQMDGWMDGPAPGIVSPRKVAYLAPPCPQLLNILKPITLNKKMKTKRIY